jgi:hypothetical protein
VLCAARCHKASSDQITSTIKSSNPGWDVPISLGRPVASLLLKERMSEVGCRADKPRPFLFGRLVPEAVIRFVASAPSAPIAAVVGDLRLTRCRADRGIKVDNRLHCRWSLRPAEPALRRDAEIFTEFARRCNAPLRARDAIG